MLGRMWREPCALLVGMKTGAATTENSIEDAQKIKNTTIVWPSNSTFRYLSKENNINNWNRYLHYHVHYNVIYNSQYMETT